MTPTDPGAGSQPPPADRESGSEGGSTTPGSDQPPIRELTDPRDMRALAHPVRLALLEALLLEGPLTATKAAELLGESPGNMSWHLQTLAKYGFVTEAGGGRGRARPWRLVTLGNRLSFDGTAGPEFEIAAETLTELYHERQFQRLREWMAQRSAYPLEWRRAAFASGAMTYLTASELAGLEEEITAILGRYRDRLVDPSLRPEGAGPVQVVAFGHPLPRPSPES